MRRTRSCAPALRSTSAWSSASSRAMRSSKSDVRTSSFLAERYVLYAGLPDGSMRLGRVHHTPYPLEEVDLHAWDEGLLAAAGITRGPEAPSALYAAGCRSRCSTWSASPSALRRTDRAT
ncbi:MAG: DUF2071 domain-containing protein [Polyangiales bacterium]